MQTETAPSIPSQSQAKTNEATAEENKGQAPANVASSDTQNQAENAKVVQSKPTLDDGQIEAFETSSHGK